MAAKIGILGESTSVATGTVTVYTVPTDKAARVRITWAAEGGGGNYQYAIMVGSPGTEKSFYATGTSVNDLWSGSAPQSTPDPGLSILAAVAGHQTVAGIDINGIAGGIDYIMTPYPADFFLSDGDTVKFAISQTDLGDGIIQVMGVEDDA